MTAGKRKQPLSEEFKSKGKQKENNATEGELVKEALSHSDPKVITRIPGALAEERLKRYELLGLSERAASLSGELGTCLVQRKGAGDSDTGMVQFCNLYGKYIIELRNRLRNAGREYSELNLLCDAIQTSPRLYDLRALNKVLDAVALDLGRQASKAPF